MGCTLKNEDDDINKWCISDETPIPGNPRTAIQGSSTVPPQNWGCLSGSANPCFLMLGGIYKKTSYSTLPEESNSEQTQIKKESNNDNVNPVFVNRNPR